ncbi:MAG: nickel-type superoxide dismutase maturation protease [Acidimicrobiia bacterium]
MRNARGRRLRRGIALLGALSGLAARHLRRIEITGESMAPALAPGDRVVVFRGGRLRTGDIVACVDPRDPNRTVVKRVAAVVGREYTVIGDNFNHSIDSRHFGPIDAKSIIGRLIFRYFPEGRTGVIRRDCARSALVTDDVHARSVEKTE